MQRSAAHRRGAARASRHRPLPRRDALTHTHLPSLVAPAPQQVAQQSPQLSVLVLALSATNLTSGSLADRYAVQTVFAPTNAAFAKLAGALGVTQAQLLARTVRARPAAAQPRGGGPPLARALTRARAMRTARPAAHQDLLRSILTYHVVPGVAAKARDLRNDQRLATLQGANVTVRLPGDTAAGATPSSVRVVGVASTATVVQADVPACRSVVHVIDTVLLPSRVA
jgi:uncharacterized surface protein with fasciclin (FAS1) repeats